MKNRGSQGTRTQHIVTPTWLDSNINDNNEEMEAPTLVEFIYKANIVYKQKTVSHLLVFNCASSVS